MFYNVSRKQAEAEEAQSCVRQFFCEGMVVVGPYHMACIGKQPRSHK